MYVHRLLSVQIVTGCTSSESIFRNQEHPDLCFAGSFRYEHELFNPNPVSAAPVGTEVGFPLQGLLACFTNVDEMMGITFFLLLNQLRPWLFLLLNQLGSWLFLLLNQLSSWLVLQNQSCS